MFFHPKNLKSENNNLWFNILLHTQPIVCATVDSQCLDSIIFKVVGIYNFEIDHDCNPTSTVTSLPPYDPTRETTKTTEGKFI